MTDDTKGGGERCLAAPSPGEHCWSLITHACEWCGKPAGSGTGRIPSPAGRENPRIGGTLDAAHMAETGEIRCAPGYCRYRSDTAVCTICGCMAPIDPPPPAAEASGEGEGPCHAGPDVKAELRTRLKELGDEYDELEAERDRLHAKLDAAEADLAAAVAESSRRLHELTRVAGDNTELRVGMVELQAKLDAVTALVDKCRAKACSATACEIESALATGATAAEGEPKT